MPQTGGAAGTLRDFSIRDREIRMTKQQDIQMRLYQTDKRRFSRKEEINGNC